jgi:hypothetical protein
MDGDYLPPAFNCTDIKDITIEIISDGQIEQCRSLCDELMRYQKSMAYIEPERFDAMNFDTRMKKSYENALEKQVVVVKDRGNPVGYIFSTIESADEMKKIPFQITSRTRWPAQQDRVHQ